MAANPEILQRLNNHVFEKTGKRVIPESGGDGNPPAKKPEPIPVDDRIDIQDLRKLNPVTGKPLIDKLRKSIKADPGTVKAIISHAKAAGIDPWDALAISYQETGINKEAPYNLNPDYFKSNTGDPKYGVQTIVDQMKYARNLQKRGVIPNTDVMRLQGYNGYGRIHAGHADLEGATSIYGYPIPHEGIDFMKNPLYGKAVISLRDEILKKNPALGELVNNTAAFQEPLPIGIAAYNPPAQQQPSLPPAIYHP